VFRNDPRRLGFRPRRSDRRKAPWARFYNPTATELHAFFGTLRITDAVSGRRLLYAVGPEDYRFGERRFIVPDYYPVTGSGSVPIEIVSDESAGITDETQVFVIDLGGESFVVQGSAGHLVSEDH
jgi:hypothetical protein